jgi:hypothetical protein
MANQLTLLHTSSQYYRRTGESTRKQRPCEEVVRPSLVALQAMAASFYASPQLGAISTFATFCHEIPHEVGLVNSTSRAGHPLTIHRYVIRSPTTPFSSSRVLPSDRR